MPTRAFVSGGASAISAGSTEAMAEVASNKPTPSNLCPNKLCFVRMPYFTEPEPPGFLLKSDSDWIRLYNEGSYLPGRCIRQRAVQGQPRRRMSAGTLVA